MLEHMVEHTGSEAEEAEPAREPIKLTVEISGSPDLAQDEIDRLMSRG
jgi:hypothetical protein